MCVSGLTKLCVCFTIGECRKQFSHLVYRSISFSLIYDHERQWTERSIDEIAGKHFHSVDLNVALKRPILFSDWLEGHYASIDEEDLRKYIQERLKVNFRCFFLNERRIFVLFFQTYYEEEVGIHLVLFNQVLDQVLRIDRVFRQPQGHLLLIGLSGTGKATLCRFVSWLNQIQFYQLKVIHPLTFFFLD